MASESYDKLFTWFSLLNSISWNIQWDKTCSRLLHNQNLRWGLMPVYVRAQYCKKEDTFWLHWVLTYSRDGDKIAQKLNPLFYCCFPQVNRFKSITLYLVSTKSTVTEIKLLGQILKEADLKITRFVLSTHFTLQINQCICFASQTVWLPPHSLNQISV